MGTAEHNEILEMTHKTWLICITVLVRNKQTKMLLSNTYETFINENLEECQDGFFPEKTVKPKCYRRSDEISPEAGGVGERLQRGQGWRAVDRSQTCSVLLDG